MQYLSYASKGFLRCFLNFNIWFILEYFLFSNYYIIFETVPQASMKWISLLKTLWLSY